MRCPHCLNAMAKLDEAMQQRGNQTIDTTYYCNCIDYEPLSGQNARYSLDEKGKLIFFLTYIEFDDHSFQVEWTPDDLIFYRDVIVVDEDGHKTREEDAPVNILIAEFPMSIETLDIEHLVELIKRAEKLSKYI